MYIALEGIDTSGKSTQISLLKERFKDAIFIKEPGFTELGNKLREILLFGDISSKRAELFLFLADRAELATKVIIPDYEKLIISDRSFISGIAYASDFDMEFLINLNKFALQDCLPKKVIILRLDEETLKSRLGKKKGDRIENQGVKELLKIQDRLIEVSKISKIQSLIIDSKESTDAIFQKIIEFLSGDLC